LQISHVWVTTDVAFPGWLQGTAFDNSANFSSDVWIVWNNLEISVGALWCCSSRIPIVGESHQNIVWSRAWELTAVIKISPARVGIIKIRY
jgi:hypothetical protein